MKDILNNIELNESYILGWKHTENDFLLYTELYLNHSHPKWEQFNLDTEFGCYKLATITFYDVLKVDGLAKQFLVPQWNDELREYKAYDEINSVDLKNNSIIINMDTTNIKIEFNKLEVNILNDHQFNL